MDYSLLLGIHDIEKTEREDEEEYRDSPCEEDEEPENGISPGSPAVGSLGTSPEGIAGYMSAHKPFGAGEFDPYIDVYAIQSAAGELPSLSKQNHKHKNTHFPSDARYQDTRSLYCHCKSAMRCY